MEIGQRAGLIEQIAGKMKPILKFLFPNLPEGHPAGDAIATNVIANVLGLGWAATPAGLKAMEELAKLEEERREREHEEIRPIIPMDPGRQHRKKGKMESIAAGMPKGMASNEMCTFLILNISSLQLIPVNMIAYRSQYGSGNPAAIVGPAIMATAVSTIVAVVFCKMMDGKRSG